MTSTLTPAPAPAPPPHEGRQGGRRRWRLRWSTVVVAVLLLAGALLLLYPSIASWVSQYYQSQLIVDVTDTQQQAKAPELHEELARAHEYNSLLVGGALIEANTNKPTGVSSEVSGFEYDTMLNATPAGVMGRLRIPAIDVDLPIYHGTDDLTLTKGVGHLEGTSLPVGGESQRSVLTAHRGLPEATLFNDLDQIEVGDEFTIEVFGEVLTYRVRESRVIEPQDTDTLRVSAGEDLVTLVTCTPLGINTHRILVTGERVTPTPIEDIQRAGAPPEIPGFPWWIVIGLGAIALVSLFVWRSGYGYSKPRSVGADANASEGASPEVL